MSKYFDVCPICGAGRFESVYGGKWSSENFFKCAGCGLILKNPQEDKSETLDRYGDEYYNYEKVNEVNFFNLVKKTMDDYKVFSLIPSGSNVLEIGCATGLFLKYMNENGFGVVSLYHTLIEPLHKPEFCETLWLSKHILNLPVHQDVECSKYVDMMNLMMRYLKNTSDN